MGYRRTGMSADAIEHAFEPFFATNAAGALVSSVKLIIILHRGVSLREISCLGAMCHFY